jgi:phytoene dehydrogenase-like protein
MLCEIYPDSSEEIDHLIRIIRKIMKHMEILYGLENPAFKDLKNDRDFLFNQLLPWLPKFIFTVGKINRMNMPIEGYLASIIKDQSLIDIISQHFFKNTPTFFALSYFSLYLDYFYPLKGVGTLAEKVQHRIGELGGEIKTGTTVTDVSLGTRIIKDQAGGIYEYDNLIWAADLKTFYRISDSTGLTPRIRKKFEKIGTSMKSHRGGDSVFTLFLQVDEPLETFGEIASGHFFYTPSKQGLGQTHWSEMRELINNFKNYSKDQVLAWLRKFTTLNTYEISIPGLKNPDLAPPGKTGMIISCLAEYDLFKTLDDAGWYKEFKAEVENQIIEVINNSVYPMLKKNIIGQFSFSPISIANWTSSSEGAIVGWSFEKSVPVVNKIQFSSRSVLTPIPNVNIAGQWAYSPAGVPMSILTGKLAADNVLKRKTN